MVRGARAAVLGGTVHLSVDVRSCMQLLLHLHALSLDVPVNLPQTANTDGLAHVDMAGHGGGTDVVPVNVLGRELLGVYDSLAMH